ncbi:hypothetical protein VTN77DRAFT_2215 [Rasamsonia byssochlamydoides]|uniref:uncharacterized protein n=1 Tax=Rasamsonia byssochlamydoides TaxID=89139 RepID=UPI003744A232
MVVLRSSLLSLVALGATVASAQASDVLGCFSSAGSLSSRGTYTYQSQNYCVQTCAKLGKTIAAVTQGSTCFCGDEAPPASDKVADDECNVPCAGYPSEPCGGSNAWTVLQSPSQQQDAANSSPSVSARTLQGGIIVDGAGTASIVPLSTPAIAIASATPTALATSRAVSKAASSTAVAASSTPTSNGASERRAASVVAAGLAAGLAFVFV